MKEKLQEAVSLYKKGDKPQALKLLAGIVRQEPNNSVAWYGLALCLDDLDKKVYCLKRVLSLDPSHKKAQQILEKLQVNKKSPNYQKTTVSQSLPVTKKDTSFSWQTVFALGIGGTILICVIIIGVALTGMNLYKPVPTPIPTPIPPTHIPRIPSIITGEPVEYVPILPNKFEVDNSYKESNETLEGGTKFLSTAFSNKEAIYNGDLVSFLYFIVICPNESQAILQYSNMVNSQTSLFEGVTYNELFLDGTNASTMYMGKKNNIMEGLYASRIENAVILTVGYTFFNPETITLEFIKGFMEGDLLKLHKLCIKKFYQ